MIASNSFEKGMSQDYSKPKYPQNAYLEALNFRVLTDEGLSTLALENTKGTTALCTIPVVGYLWYILPSIYSDTLSSVDFTFFHPVSGSETLTVSNILTLSSEELYILIRDFLISVGYDEFYKITYNSSYPVLQAYINNTADPEVSYTNSGGPITKTLSPIHNDDKFEPFILGWGVLRDEIVLLVGNKNSVSATPTNEIGQVWKFKIDERTDQVIGSAGLLPPGAPLEPSEHLVYNNLLNFSRYYNICNEVKTRYESNTVGTVVWTDFYNELRVINVYDPQVAAVPPFLLNYLPSNPPTQPVVTNIINGGLLLSGTYQYFYRLKTLQGSYTTYSPLSQHVEIGEFWNPGFPGTVSPQINSNSGSAAGVTTTKSIEITFRNLDTSYDVIEIGFLLYQTKDAPEAFIFNELLVPTSGELTIVHNGTENLINLDAGIGESLSNSNRPPDTFKTIEVSRNRLFAANAASKSRKLNFDARAYRYNNAVQPLCNLYDSLQDGPGSPQVVINGATGVITVNGSPVADLLDIPDSLNLINPYNFESNSLPVNFPLWETVSQYMYQSDGVTIGGEGPNISYSFVSRLAEQVETGTAIQTLPPYKSPVVPNITPYDPGNGYTVDLGTLYRKDYGSYVEQQFVGYARGEVYRFGIVFYDKAGYPFLVEWIGDIKFPTPDASTDFRLNTGSNTRTIGIKFRLDTTTVQFQNIKDKISGWQFVRVKRELKDKTRLGTGIQTNLLNMAGLANSCCMGLGAQNVETMGAGATTTRTDLMLVDTPNFLCRVDNNYIIGDYIKLFGNTGDANVSLTQIPAVSQGFVTLFDNNTYYSFLTSIGNKFTVNNRLEADYVTDAQSINIGGVTVYNMGFQNTSGLTDFEEAGSRTNVIQVAGYLPLSISTGSPNSQDRYLVSYERYLTTQYGGPTRFARYGNEYIPTGGVYTYTDQTGQIDLEVWGGDCYTCWFDYSKLGNNITSLTGFTGASTGQGMFWIFPAEAHSFNPKMRDNSRRGTRIAWTVSEWPLENLDINLAYTENAVQQVFYSEFFNVNTSQDEPHNIYVTDPKLDGQQLNSWRNFRVLNTMTVNGSYGPINKLIEFKESVFFVQNDAIGVVTSEQKEVVATESGAATSIGTGTVLERYDYLSTQTGSFHQFGVTKSGEAIYHYDIFLNKMFKTTGQGVEPLTDVKGLSGFFRYAFSGDILDRDQLFMPDRAGIQAVFNPEYNSVLFTFLDDDTTFTISYNQNLGGFESFHSFSPSIFINTRRRLHSVHWDGANHNAIYTHWRGPYNFYYDDYHSSYIKLLTNGQNPYEKTWDNQEWRTEVTYNGADLQESISRILFTTDYQTSGLITLIPNNNFKRLIRTWRLQIPMDQSNPALIIKPRMTDRYLITEAWYDQVPGQERRIIIHDLLTEYSLRGKILPK